MVDVTVINDASAGPRQHRNLVVTGVVLNGVITPVDAVMTAQDQTATVTVSDGTATTPAPIAAGAWHGFQYLGVNLSGAEFGLPSQEWGGVTIVTDYTFLTHAEIAAAAAHDERGL